jgi:hypothetical protein
VRLAKKYDGIIIRDCDFQIALELILKRKAMKKYLIYDCEIINCIPGRDGYQKPGFTYCKGWNDHANMGISLIGAYLSWKDSIVIYPQSAFNAFQKAVDEAHLIVGYNSISFDDKLCQANGIRIQTDYDLLSEVWAAAGMPRQYTAGVTRAGYKLENLAQANLGKGKSGSGELAPELWQQGRQSDVVRYVTDDVLITKALFDRRSSLIDPTDLSELCLREPWEPIQEGARFLDLDSISL